MIPILAVSNSTTTGSVSLSSVVASPLFIFLAGVGSILFIVYFAVEGYGRIDAFLGRPKITLDLTGQRSKDSLITALSVTNEGKLPLYDVTGKISLILPEILVGDERRRFRTEMMSDFASFECGWVEFTATPPVSTVKSKTLYPRPDVLP